jgi:hypothetical protein
MWKGLQLANFGRKQVHKRFEVAADAKIPSAEHRTNGEVISLFKLGFQNANLPMFLF